MATCSNPTASHEFGWQLVREPEEDTHFSAIHFADHEHGWAVGDSGTIIATKNGGSSWQKQSSGSNSALRTVYFVDSMTGWAGGRDATLLHTVDGGKLWQRQPIPIDSSNGIFTIHFSDNLLGWLIHNGGEILNTVDGGETWEPQLSWDMGGAGRLAMVDHATGYVFPAIDTSIWKTQNGGQLWTAIKRPQIRWPTDMFFVSEQKGWIVNDKLASSLYVDYANVFYTKDGGESWACLDTLPEKHISAIHFADDRRGWLTTQSQIYATTDGGNTWICDYDSENEDFWLGFQDLFFIDDTHGWALDYRGGICRYTRL
ncbi:MAG: hypothetical protein KAU50_02790 [Candidatus Marinimicrobia bacterium]|nr:hypothetical protein [Candidatus Neomarinimicrobiota bacterium]